MSEARNKLVGGIFKSSWEKLTDKITEAGLSIEDYEGNIKTLAKKHNVDLDKMIKKEGNLEKALQKAFNNKKLDKSILSEALKALTGDIDETTEAAENMGKTTEELGKVVDQVIRGDFGDGAARIKALKEAGYDYATVQNLVNEKLGISKRHISELTEEQLKNADSLADLSDKQLKNKGYTDEQIKAIRELAEEADKAGTSISDLIDSFDKPSGRELLIDTFKNAWEAISKIFEGIKTAWDETFDFNLSDGLYNMINNIHTFSEGLTDIDEAVGKINRIAKGVFAFIKLFTSFGTKLGIVGFNVLRGVLGLTNLDLLELAAKIGDAIVKVKDLIFNNKLLAVDLGKIADAVVNVILAFTGWINKFLELPGVQKTIENIRNAISSVVDFVKELTSGSKSLSDAFKEIGDKISGFFNKIVESVPFLSNAIELVKSWIDALSKVPMVQKGIAAITDLFKSISNNFSEAYEIGKNVIEGIIQGLKDGSMTLGQAIIEIGKMLINAICNVLGIHSPSVEFYKIGQNLITGLINGIQNGASKVWETIKNIGKKCIDTIKEIFSKIDFGAVMAAGFGVGIILLSKKMLDLVDRFADIAEAFSAPFKGLGKMFDGIGAMFKGMGENFKAQAWKQKSKAILNMAIAIGILAAAAVVLTKVDAGKLWASIGALAALAAIILALSFAASKLNDVGDYGKQSIALVAMAGSMLILAIALKKLSTIKAEKTGTVLKLLAGMIIGMSTLLAATGAFVNSKLAVNIDKAGVMLLKMSAALLIMTFVIKQISKLEGGDITKGLAVIAALELMFAGIMYVSKFAGTGAAKAGSMLLMMSGALLIMVGVIKAAAGLKPEEVLKGIGVISQVMILFAGVIAVSKFAGANATKAGAMLLMMSMAIAIIPFVIKQISELSDADVKRGLGVIAAVEVLFGALIAVSKLAGNNAIKAGAMLLMMSGALLILVGVMALIGLLDPADTWKAIGVITVLELLFAGLIAVTYLAKDCKTTLITITVTIGLLVAALAALTLLDQQKLLTSAASISSVMAAFALIIASTKFAGSAKSTIGTVVMMLAVVGVLGGVVIGLAKLDANSALNASISLALLLTSFATSLAIINATSKFGSASIKQLAVMTLVVAGLAGILGMLSYFDVEPSIEAAKAISILLLAMSGAMVILGVAGKLGTSAIGALAIMTLVVGGLAAILGLMSYFDVNPSIETAKALSILLLSMSGALVILGVVGLLGPAAFIGIAALATLIVGIGGIVVAIGALVDKFPALETFLDKGIPVLEKIGTALGSFFGSIVGGFIDGVTNGLPGVGQDLADFITNAQPFIDGVKSIDETVMSGVESLCKAIVTLTEANFISGVTSFLSLGSSFANLGTELSNFMVNAKGFIDEAATLTPESMTGVKLLAETIAILTEAKLLEGLNAWMGGEKSLSAFGTELAAFGPSIATFSDSVSNINIEAVEASAKAAKTLADLANSLPSEGGLLSKIYGDSNIQTFGTQLVAFGEALTGYSAAVSADGALDVSAISNSVKAAKKLVELQSSLEPMNGLMEFFTGTKSLSLFGTQLIAFGKAMVSYSAAVSAEGAIDSEAIGASIKAAKKLAGLQSSLEPIGGVISWFKGKDDLGTFGQRLAEFGTSMKTYCTEVGTISTSTLSSSTAEFKKLADLAKGLSEINFDGMSSFSTALKKLGKSGVSKFIDAFDGAKDKVSKAGSRMVEKFIDGAEDKSGSMKTAFKGLAYDAVDGVKAKYSSFYGAGEYLGDGLVAGIEAKETDAYNAGYALGQAAVQGEKDGQKSNSPSKLTIQAGKWLGEGLVVGIDKMTSSVYKSGYNMGDSAVSSISSAISRISESVNTNIDSQPTIRPVLDLSDIRSGAGAIGNLLNINPSVGVTSNLGAISSMMNNRIQNGGNDDVISAIDKLGKSLGNVGGDTYNFGGFTYSGDDEINNAVKVIIRAARLGGRV